MTTLPQRQHGGQIGDDQPVKPRRLSFSKPDPVPVQVSDRDTRKVDKPKAAKPAKVKQARPSDRRPAPVEERAKKDTSRRLPHGSTFTAVYDHSQIMWFGTLATTINGQPVVFTCQCTAVFGLMRHLDLRYRRAIKTGVVPTTRPAIPQAPSMQVP